MAFDWLSTISGLYGLYGSSRQMGLAGRAADAADPFGPYRGQASQELMALMADPSAITKDPGYKFQFEEGQQALGRGMAAEGFLGSGNMGIALTRYGQDYASKYLMDKMRFLAELGGAGIPANYGPAMQGYSMGLDTASRSLASLGYGVTKSGGMEDIVSQIEKAFGLGGSSFSSVGSGAVANEALAEAGFGAGAGAGAGAFGAVGSGAAANAALAEAGFGGATSIAPLADLGGEVGGAAGGAFASSGITTAVPAAAIGWALADMINAPGDKASGAVEKWLGEIGAKRGRGARQGYITLPDGRLARVDENARRAALAYYSGDPGYQALYEQWLATAKG